MAMVRIPASMRKLAGGHHEVPVAGKSVGEVLAELGRRHPGLGDRILDEKGGVRRFVNIFLMDQDIRFLQQLATPVQETDEISIVAAVAGG